MLDSRNYARSKSAAEAHTRGGVPDLERLIPAPAEHAGAVRREGAGDHWFGVPAQGALFHTCQGERSSVSDSSTQLKHTKYCHGTTNTPSGTTLRLTQEIKRRLKACKRRAPVSASQILSVLSQLPLSTLLPSGEKEQEVTMLECPLRVRFSTPAKEGATRSQTLARNSSILETTMGPRIHGVGPLCARLKK